MNTKPDEMMLALWLEDELEGKDLAAVEAWALTQPDQLAARQEVRDWKKMVSTALPAAEEPPFPDFFNSRIEQSIRELTPKPVPRPATVTVTKFSIWKSWLMPASAFAGMALAFWIGMKTQDTPVAVPVAKVNPPLATPASYTPLVYSPEIGVDAHWYSSSPASAAVIVLQGVNAIPDSTDFTQTVMIPTNREMDSTAGQPTGGGVSQPISR
ncbi:hypothetical protein JIN85_01700 [Luteolibacter pohnpeiensis]|uniref:Uncharacterized protein n=1 Tax=Luteolibacter pohnpeiensis TaxID=454153 RepID=A0A934VT47_9BACT|nr:hypothetical protein [Luteolibacter pohnpeiensis]MBK1881107.1 hypothetical protein [Luteolibacter pohnpeiensis]